MPARKAKSQAVHALRRAKERYGLTLSVSDLANIANRIGANDTRTTRFVERKTNRVSIWEVEFSNTVCLVAYDKTRHTVCTFIPRQGE